MLQGRICRKRDLWVKEGYASYCGKRENVCKESIDLLRIGEKLNFIVFGGWALEMRFSSHVYTKYFSKECAHFILPSRCGVRAFGGAMALSPS